MSKGTSTSNNVGRVISAQLVSKFSPQRRREKVKQELHRGLSKVYPAGTAELFSHCTTSLHQSKTIITAEPQYHSAKPQSPLYSNLYSCKVTVMSRVDINFHNTHHHKQQQLNLGTGQGNNNVGKD